MCDDDDDDDEVMDAAAPHAAHPADMAKEDSDGDQNLSLGEILFLYDQPINEEQAWAVCYQCCRDLSENLGSGRAGIIRGPEDVRIYKDGTVRMQRSAGKERPASSSITPVIESLGIMIYKALDFGLKDTEERELSPPLEQLIDLMTNTGELTSDPCPDEGYEATEDEDELGRDSGGRRHRDVLKRCAAHLPSPADAPDHYQAVCRALYAETLELRTFLEKIRSAKENLRRMEGDAVDSAQELTELQSADWARFWVQVMRDLRTGVKLKKVQERQYNPLPFEFQLTPYEMLMDDIRAKRYTLRKVMVNGDIPPRLKKSAHEIILDFIRSRPPLNPVSARKLKPQAERPPSLHERILEEIKSERKLRPVSPDQIRRSRMAIRPLSMSQSFDSSDISTPEGAKKTSSSLSLANGSSLQKGGGSVQRKRLHAPTLAEMTSSDSDDEAAGRRSASGSGVTTPDVDDTSPESGVGKKTPPMFLPISSTPQPERKQSAQRRHSIEKETPTSVRQFVPPSRHSSRSLEEFCFPVECLSLTVEEVMHIRQVLVKAELEKFQQYKDVYNALKKGKLCFCCRTKRFSFFTWSYTCQFCIRPVCSQCCKKIRLPSKPYANLPIFSLGPSTSTLSRDKTDKTSTGQRRASLHRTMSRLSRSPRPSPSDLELPRDLTEDWSTMEVCVDCKKFISDLISSSKHSMSLATKRGRMKLKTRSFVAPPSTGAEYRPSERTIHEV